MDLVVTSPPYRALHTYTDGGQRYPGQIGAEATPREFIAALLAATREMTRVLTPTWSIFVNLGDTYATSARGPDGSSSGLSNGTQFRVGAGRSWRAAGVPRKSLLLPERYRIACVDNLGLTARQVIVWAKPNSLPESVTDRVRRSHEDWVHLTRGPCYYAAVDEIREPHVRGWGGAPNGGHTYTAMRPAGA